ncbi:MAG: efflux RND transporter periplasmic adaptor subunit [Chloroflexota bacterium]
MDKARDPEFLKRRQRRRWALAGGIVLLLVVGGLAVARLKPAPPTLDGSSVWPDQVKRGTMVRQVRGLGTLVPVEVRTIPAITEGRVEEIPVLPGSAVKASTVLVRLANPTLVQAWANAQAQLQGAEADLANLRATLQAARLDAQSTQANLEAGYRQARLLSDNDKKLVARGLVAQLDASTDAAKAAGLEQQVAIGAQRLKSLSASDAAQIDSSQAKVQQMRNAAALAHTQAAALDVRAGIDGLLEGLDVGGGAAASTPLQVGQWVTVGTAVARVVQPQHLKAEIKVAETDARDVALSQPATIDTHNGVVPGHVIRIDPNALNGTVAVDVALDGPLPPGARPDLSVDGTINIETLPNVVYVGRPAFGQPDQTVSMFRISPDGRNATRVQVELGKASVNTVQVVRGLEVGDWVVLSDTSADDSYSQVRFSPPIAIH